MLKCFKYFHVKIALKYKFFSSDQKNLVEMQCLFGKTKYIVCFCIKMNSLDNKVMLVSRNTKSFHLKVTILSSWHAATEDFQVFATKFFAAAISFHFS